MNDIIDLRDFSIWFVIYSFSRAFTDYLFIHAITKDKFNKYVTLLTTLLLYGIYEAVNQNIKLLEENIQGFDVLFVFIFILKFFVQLAIIAACADEKPKEKIISTVKVYFLSLIKTVSATAALSFFATNEEVYILDNSPIYLSTVKITLTISLLNFVFGYLLTIAIGLLGKHREHASAQSLKQIYFYLFPVTNIVPTVLLYALVPTNTPDYSKGYMFFCSIIYILVFSVDIFAVFIVDRIIQTDEQNKQLTIKATKSELEYQHALIVNDEQEQLRRIRHDIRNINKTAKDLIISGKADEAIKLLDESSEETTKIADIDLCRSSIINTVLYMKTSEAKEFGVKFFTDINENTDCKISDIDIGRILLNLCDNATNAAKECENKQVKIQIDINDKLIKIHTENHFVNTKTKKPLLNHGYGTKIIKQISKKYGGEYTAKTSNDIYATDTVLRNINIKADCQ